MSSVFLRHGQHKIPNAVITWAGICPWTNTYCFGSEDGKVGISPGGRQDIGKKETNWTKPVKVASAPVNSFAFLGQFAAVTSRHEIVVLRNSRLSKTHFSSSAALVYTNGAHNVLALSAIKEFVAPIGAGGFVRISPRHPGQSTVRLEQTKERGLNFYKFAQVAVDVESVLIAAACRKGGIAAFWLKQGKPPSMISRHVFGRGDLVDIVPIGDPRTPRGVIGLSKDGSLVWIEDVLSKDPPRTLSPRFGIDTAYTLLLIQGHGLVLAENTLSCLPDLANGLVTERELINGFTLPLDGDELLPAPSDSFFLLTDGQPKEFEIKTFIQDTKALRETDAPQLEPPKRPHLSFIIESDVSQYGYSPAELGWSREADAQFATQ